MTYDRIPVSFTSTIEFIIQPLSSFEKNYKNCKEIRCSFLVSPAESMILWGILKILIGGFREGRNKVFVKADIKLS